MPGLLFLDVSAMVYTDVPSKTHYKGLLKVDLQATMSLSVTKTIVKILLHKYGHGQMLDPLLTFVVHPLSWKLSEPTFLTNFLDNCKFSKNVRVHTQHIHHCYRMFMQPQTFKNHQS